MPRVAERSSLSRVRCAAPKTGAPLTTPGPFRTAGHRDGRLRRDRHYAWCWVHTPPHVSDPPAVPRRTRVCATEFRLPIRPTGCFLAGRFSQTQSSWTAECCSRKWMSGPADAWAELKTDRDPHVVAQFLVSVAALAKSAGRALLFLDKSLSWMTHFPTHCPPGIAGRQDADRGGPDGVTASIKVSPRGPPSAAATPTERPLFFEHQ